MHSHVRSTILDWIASNTQNHTIRKALSSLARSHCAVRTGQTISAIETHLKSDFIKMNEQPKSIVVDNLNEPNWWTSSIVSKAEKTAGTHAFVQRIQIDMNYCVMEVDLSIGFNSIYAANVVPALNGKKEKAHIFKRPAITSLRSDYYPPKIHSQNNNNTSTRIASATSQTISACAVFLTKRFLASDRISVTNHRWNWANALEP